MPKKEDLLLILEEIKKDTKKILELLENPKKEISNERAPNKNSDGATDKQLYFLKKAGVKIKENLSKTEAFQLIKEIKEKNKGKNVDWNKQQEAEQKEFEENGGDY